MEKNMKYRYGKYMVLGIAGVATAAAVAFGMSDKVSAKTTSERSETYDTVVPSAGIALLLNNEDDGKDIDKNVQDVNFTGGIASLINSYYGVFGQEEKISIKAVDKVLKLLPGESEADVVNNTEPTEVQTQELPQEQVPVTSVVSEYTVLGVANVTNYLNVRETPDLEGKLLGKLPMNAGCEILETLDGWYKVRSGNVEGYVSAEFLLTGEAANQRALEVIAAVARVNADMLMVREQPNTDCTITLFLPRQK